MLYPHNKILGACAAVDSQDGLVDLLGWQSVAGHGSVSEILSFCGVLAPLLELWECMSLHYQ